MKKFVLLAAVALTTLGLAIPAAQAAPLSGKVGATVVGGLLDLNGSGGISAADSWDNAFGATEIINGGIDCDNWGGVPNDGSDGLGLISFLDDCTLIGVDGTANGQIIQVTNGSVVEVDGAPVPVGFKMPTTYNAASPTDTSVVASDFTFTNVIGGRVDAFEDGIISIVDDNANIVNGWALINGEVDVNANGNIGDDDDSASGYFGLAVADGLVQAGAVVSPVTVTSFTPTSGPVGTIVTVTGTGFAAGATVTFNGKAATTVTDITATTLKATVPDGATDGPIKVTVGANSGTSTASFDVSTPSGTGECTQSGTGASNTLVGTPESDVLCGKGGDDLLQGKQGDDILKGGKGDDILKGGKGFDTCKGGKGDDTIKGCEA